MGQWIAIKKTSREDVIECQEPEADVEEGKTNHHQAHYGAGAECHLQATVQALASRIGGAGRSVGGCLHAEVATQAREETACNKGKGDNTILYTEDIGQNREDNKEHHKGNDHHPILTSQVGHSAFTHRRCDFDHARRAFTHFHHRLIEIDGKTQRNQAPNRP